MDLGDDMTDPIPEPPDGAWIAVFWGEVRQPELFMRTDEADPYFKGNWIHSPYRHWATTWKLLIQDPDITEIRLLGEKLK